MTTKKASSKKPVTLDVPVVEETREQKLARLANKRVTAALNKIRLIGNLSAYKPTDEDVDKICVAIADAAQRLEARLRGVRREHADFTL